IFVDFQAQAVTGAVKESDVYSFPDFGRITALVEQRLDRLVDLHSIHAIFDFAQREFLAVLYGLPKFALRLARAPAHNCPRHVAPIASLRVARENIEYDQRVRIQRTEATLVWIACLVSAGNDRIGWRSARSQHRRVDFGAQQFRS